MLTFKYILVIVFFILIPLGFSYFIYSFIKKRNYPSKYRLLALLPMLFLTYGIYQGLVNPYSLYKIHFKEITQLELPPSTQFLDYTNWGYDGTTPRNNSSLFYIKVDTAFYNRLKNQLLPTSEKMKIIDKDYAFRFQKIIGEDYTDKIDLHFSYFSDDGQLIYFIGFFEKGKSLLVFCFRE